jgi:uncharacterized protein YbjQ (UPF0145 family)
MILVNTDFVPHREIQETLGIVRGNTIQAKHIGKDIVAGFRHVVGGEIKEYTDMLSEAREVALQRMTQKAEEQGADAVINVRFITAGVMGGAAEILAYGTAVKLKQ